MSEMQENFKEMTTGILKKIDDMGSRLTNLESSVSKLVAESGVSEEENH
jgi:hypothetical protein